MSAIWHWFPDFLPHRCLLHQYRYDRGGLAKSENQAEPLCWIISMPLAVLSGVWFSQEIMPGYIQFLGNIFPYSHAVSAARMVIIRGAEFSAVSGSIVFLACWAVIAFSLGIILFRYKMRA